MMKSLADWIGNDWDSPVVRPSCPVCGEKMAMLFTEALSGAFCERGCSDSDAEFQAARKALFQETA